MNSVTMQIAGNLEQKAGRINRTKGPEMTADQEHT
jgi:hypothetical protein